MRKTIPALVLGLFLAAPEVRAADPTAAYRSALGALKAEHAAVARHWYQVLDASQTAAKPLILRLVLPRTLGNPALSLEILQMPGQPPDTRLWATTGTLRTYAADWKNFDLTGSPGSGALNAEFQVDLPDEITAGPGGTVPVTVKLTAKIAGGRVTGTFDMRALSAKRNGAVSGQALLPAAAAAAATRALPPLDPAKAPASCIYATGALLEDDTCRLYRRIRALIAAGGDCRKYPTTFIQVESPIPIRPTFKTGTPEKKNMPPQPKGKKKGKTAPSSDLDIPDIDDIDSVAVVDTPKAAPEKPKGDDPKEVQARLPAMQAMAAHVTQIRKIIDLARSNPSSPPVQRGTSFDDPLFMPIFGAASLAPDRAKVNRLPPDTGTAGVQDWPFVHAWNFIGPFVLPAADWDPVRLPDCFETPEADYSAKAGASRWRPARIRATGHAWLTDLGTLGVAYADEPDAPVPAKVNMAAVYFCTTTIQAERDADVWLAAGCRGFMSVWIDDVLVARGPDRPDASSTATETMLFKVSLRKGDNRLFVRCEAEQYGLFTHRRPGTASPFWMRACVRGAPGDPGASKAFLDAAAARKKDLPNLPPNVQGYRMKQDGFYPGATPVTAWDLERGINVKWVTPIIQWSKGSPVVVGDRVFVTADPHVLVCLDAMTGKILWERSANVLEVVKPAAFPESERLWQAYADARRAAEPKLAELGPHYAAQLRAIGAQGVDLPKAIQDLCAMGEARKEYQAFWKHLCANVTLVKPAWDGHFSGPWFIGYSFPTPVTDGAHIYCKFTTGAVACFDLDGNRKWLVNTPYVDGGLTVGASPVLADDKVIIAQAAYPPDKELKVARDLDFRFIALDAKTGKTVWTTPVDEPDRETSSPVVMRLTNGKEDMTVVVSDGGTVVRASDGKVLIGGLWGGSGAATATTIGDLYVTPKNVYRLVMLDRDHVGAVPVWSVHRQGSYSGIFHHDGILYYLSTGSAQSFGKKGPLLLDLATGAEIERPPRLSQERVGIFIIGRDSYVPPTGNERHIFWGVRGQRHASSLREELPDKFKPWTYVSVMQQGPHARFIAHNEVAEPLTPHLALAGTRVYMRNDKELICFDYTGDEGRAYEAEVNAKTLLDELPPKPPADPEGAESWRESLKLCKPYFERVVELKPDSDTAKRAQALLAQ